jgi:hypothetical protein
VASGMTVALTGFTVESMNFISSMERLVIIERQAAITLEKESNIKINRK